MRYIAGSGSRCTHTDIDAIKARGALVVCLGIIDWKARRMISSHRLLEETSATLVIALRLFVLLLVLFLFRS